MTAATAAVSSAAAMSSAVAVSAVPGLVVARPAQVVTEVVSVEREGEYHRLVLAGEGVALARPGQFVAVAVGGDGSPLVAARAFSIHEVDLTSQSVSLLVAVVGPGTAWLARRRPGDQVPVTGPLGRGFTVTGSTPGAHRGWVGVGGGYGTAPLAWAAREAAAAGAATAVIAGAGTAGRLCDVAGLRREVGERLWVTTDDGTAGAPGRVTDALPAAIAAVSAGGRPVTVAACGPMAMLAAVWRFVASGACRDVAGDVTVEVAVEERMACGIGICMTCVLPIVGHDGRTRMARSCIDGPVIDAAAVRWDALTGAGAAVPDDAVGAPRVLA